MPYSKIKFWVLFVFSTVWSIAGLSEEVEKTIVGISKNPVPEMARQEILDQTQKQATIDFVIQMIGKDKYQKNTLLVETKILSQSPRFLISYRTADLVSTANASQMKVIMQFELSELRKLLAAQKLLILKPNEKTRPITVIVQNTQGLVPLEKLKSEIQAQLPQIQSLKESALTSRSAEFLGEVEQNFRLGPEHVISLLGKKCKLNEASDDKIEIVLER